MNRTDQRAEPYDVRLESLPDSTTATIEVRDAWRRRVAASGAGLEFLVSDLGSWSPGSTVRVAFLGGDTALHSKIVGATRQITDTANLTLDFGGDEATGYRRWTPADTSYAADIRVSFDMDGYFSLVGTDSTDRTIGRPGDPIGGGPGQRSLNLHGFDVQLPARWEGTVRHEFLHALAFHHEHQNMRGPCSDDFRWEDDAGYVPTKDAAGRFVKDQAGRSPGIYTYLAGFPNFWPRPKVDHNLRTAEAPELVAGPFDAASVMLYRFAEFFYLTNPSPCAPTGNGVDLSAGDKRALQLLYPHAADAVAEVVGRAEKALGMIGSGLEAGIELSDYPARVVELLQARTG